MKKTYKLQDLCCANCAAKIETGLNRRPEITKATISFMTQKLTIDLDETRLDEIMKEAVKVVKNVDPECEILL